MANTNGTFRHKQIPFTQIANTLAKDTTISHKAKGLYLLIQAYITIPDFLINKTFLLKNSLEGEKAFESSWKELKAKGYLKQYRIRTESNKFIYEYDLLDVADMSTPSTINVNSKGEIIKPKTCETYPPQNVGGTKDTVYKTDTIQNGGDIIISYSNNTDYNNTDNINQSEPSHKNPQLKNQIIDNMIDEIDTYNQIIKQNISYNLLLTNNKNNTEQVEEIFNIILETVTTNKKTIRIGGTDQSTALVKSKFLKLEYDHIQYVIDSLSKNTNKIKNVNAYLLTTLYNSLNTINTYYQNRVNHDLRL